MSDQVSALCKNFSQIWDHLSLDVTVTSMDCSLVRSTKLRKVQNNVAKVNFTKKKNDHTEITTLVISERKNRIAKYAQ